MSPEQKLEQDGMEAILEAMTGTSLKAKLPQEEMDNLRQQAHDKLLEAAMLFDKIHDNHPADTISQEYALLIAYLGYIIAGGKENIDKCSEMFGVIRLANRLLTARFQQE